MSHNLKTPLNSLVINNEIQETQIVDKNSLAFEILQKDRQNLILLKLLVCDILDFSKLYSDEFKPNCSYFQLDSFLSGMKELFYDQAIQKNIKIEV